MISIIFYSKTIFIIAILHHHPLCTYLLFSRKRICFLFLHCIVIESSPFCFFWCNLKSFTVRIVKLLKIDHLSYLQHHIDFSSILHADSQRRQIQIRNFLLLYEMCRGMKKIEPEESSGENRSWQKRNKRRCAFLCSKHI